MTAHRARLTEFDIRRLIKATDEDERAAAAHKLCRSIDRVDLTDEDREAAQKILRVLANDAAELVRRAMAVTLKSSDLLPRDVARQLAADVDSIALPIIGFSPVFSDEDLIEIVRAGSAVRQVAIAARPEVSRDVAEVLSADGCEQAVRTLASNDNADLSEARAWAPSSTGSATTPEVVAALAYRQVLPLDDHRAAGRPGVRRGARASDQPPCRGARDGDPAVDLRARAGDRRSDRSGGRPAPTWPRFVGQLNARKALTASLLLRALARGQMALFEHGMAELAVDAASAGLADGARRRSAGPEGDL